MYRFNRTAIDTFPYFFFYAECEEKRKHRFAKLALSFPYSLSLSLFFSWSLSIFSPTCLNVRFAMRQVVTATCAQPE